MSRLQNAAPRYHFDGSMTGLLCCVFRAFQFKEFEVQIQPPHLTQHGLFDALIDIPSQEAQAERVWRALKTKISQNTLRQFHYTFLSESPEAYQHLFRFCLDVFRQSERIENNYLNPHVLAMAQWTKKVGREKHRMEAFVRFKKTADDVFVSLVRPDFNVLPLIQKHFKARYQDQRWLIFDEKRHYGIYYDLDQVHEVSMNAKEIDRQIEIGHSQNFTIQLDEDEALYDQLWQDYFNSVNIKERQNIKLHVQYLPKRYWRYLNEKVI